MVLDTNVVLSALLFGGGPAGRRRASKQDLLADYLPGVEVVRIPDPPPLVPHCRDAFDLPFLYLAIAGTAHSLVSGDKDLLALAGARGLCPLLSVDAFCRQLPTTAP